MTFYPPTTRDPATTATPERTTRLNTRGTILPSIEYCMYTLQQLYPRRIFPAGDAAATAREPQLDPVGWRRGGTSPSGASLGGTPGGNYFVGSPDKYIRDAAPQRIIWEPPAPGEEEWGPPQQHGYFVDPSTQQLPQLRTPPSPENQQQYREMGDRASAPFATRIIPMRVHLWGSDYDDTEELIHWFASAVQVCFNGTLNNQWLHGPGGWTDEKDSRGLHYELVVRFAAPVMYPYWAEREATAASLRLSGAAPFKPEPR